MLSWFLESEKYYMAVNGINYISVDMIKENDYVIWGLSLEFEICWFTDLMFILDDLRISASLLDIKYTVDD